VQSKKESVARLIQYLESNQLTGDVEINSQLESLGTSPLKGSASLIQVLRRPEISFEQLRCLKPEIPAFPLCDVDYQVETQVKYEGYVNRQLEIVERFQKMENVRLPDDIDYSVISGLSREVREKLTKIRPRSLGQASRISGITPAALTILSFHLKKKKSA
jgi:tRNA uridine 5-carboxymethylaminomethyl modification enzyme